MLTQEEIDNWEEGYGVVKLDKQEKLDELYSTYLWSADYLPFGALIQKLKEESKTTATQREIANYIKDI